MTRSIAEQQLSAEPAWKRTVRFQPESALGTHFPNWEADQGVHGA